MRRVEGSPLKGGSRHPPTQDRAVWARRGPSKIIPQVNNFRQYRTDEGDPVRRCRSLSGGQPSSSKPAACSTDALDVGRGHAPKSPMMRSRDLESGQGRSHPATAARNGTLPAGRPEVREHVVTEGRPWPRRAAGTPPSDRCAFATNRGRNGMGPIRAAEVRHAARRHRMRAEGASAGLLAWLAWGG